MMSVDVTMPLRDYDLDVRFKARSARCVALVGPIGCGKTRTLRIIAGLLRPSAGRVEMEVLSRLQGIRDARVQAAVTVPGEDATVIDLTESEIEKCKREMQIPGLGPEAQITTLIPPDTPCLQCLLRNGGNGGIEDQALGIGQRPLRPQPPAPSPARLCFAHPTWERGENGDGNRRAAAQASSRLFWR